MFSCSVEPSTSFYGTPKLPVPPGIPVPNFNYRTSNVLPAGQLRPARSTFFLLVQQVQAPAPLGAAPQVAAPRGVPDGGFWPPMFNPLQQFINSGHVVVAHSAWLFCNVSFISFI